MRERKEVCGCLTLNEDDSHRVEWMSDEDKFCDDQRADCPQNDVPIFEKCGKECPKDCLIYTVEYTISEETRPKNKSFQVSIFHSYSKESKVITHTPGMDFGIFVANIGGLAGFWLGFSAIAFYDQIVLFINTIIKYFNRK